MLTCEIYCFNGNSGSGLCFKYTIFSPDCSENPTLFWRGLQRKAGLSSKKKAVIITITA